MKFAIKNGERIEAIPNNIGICPICKSEVISKCGDINIWHWSHKNMDDCDSWSSGETLWHREWKNNFPEKNQEVTIKGTLFSPKSHRADVKLDNGLVIEFQSSPITSEEITERESFYGDMIWVIKLSKNNHIRTTGTYGNNSYSFRWLYPRKSFWYSNRPVYVDIGNEVILLKKVHHNIPCGGWGIIIKKESFIKIFTNKK